MPRKREDPEARFWSKVQRTTEDDCWEWTAGKSSAGYGAFRLGRREGMASAHRYSYVLARGPIPDGLQLDHLCRNRSCVNPTHLEAVTLAENVLRGECDAARNARKTHCPKGHAYDRVDRHGHRQCLSCRRDANERWRARNAA